MKTISNKLGHLTFVVITMCVMAACSIIIPESPSPVSTSSTSATFDVGGTLPSSITPSIEPTITKTAAPTATPIPTETPSPTITPSPTYIPITPVLQGTSLPEHGDVINANNSTHLTLLARWGQGNSWDVAFTPDGKYFVVGAGMGLYFYHVSDYSLAHYIDTQAAVIAIAISPDSQKIAIVAAEKVVLYQVGDWQLLLTIQVDASSVDFSPDNRILALDINSTGDYLQLREAGSGKVIGTFKNEQGVWSVKISPQGNVIATGGFSTTIWSIDGSILDQHGPYVSGGSTGSVSFSPDGNFLAEGSDDGLRIWRVLENGRIINYREIDLNRFDNAWVIDVAISPNSKLVAATLSVGFGVWDLSKGFCVFCTDAENGFIQYNSLAWSMDSKTIAVTSYERGVELWNITAGESLASLNTTSGSFSSIAWSPDGQKLAVGAEEGSAYIFDAHNGNVLEHFGSGYQLNSLAFSRDGQMLALGYGDRTVQVWKSDGTILHTLDGFGFGSSDATFSSDGSLFAATQSESWQSPPQVRFWNTNNWSVVKTFSVGNRDDFMITGFALAFDQTMGAISYVDMNTFYKDYIEIISVTDGGLLTDLRPIGKHARVFIDAVAFSPDDSLLGAFVSEFGNPYPRILVWKTSNWSLLYEESIGAGSRLGWSMNERDALAWSPDSTLIALGVKDGSIRILNALNGEALNALMGHTMWVTGVSFSPDGRILASISLDGTIMLWGIR